MKARLLSDIAQEVLDSIQAVGWNETFGLSPHPSGRRCDCGGGCESPIECKFWRMMQKTDLVERGCKRQAWIGRRRVDALCECDGERIAVELDGKDWHKDFEAEQRRDAELISEVDAVVHIPGAAIHWFPEAVFCLLGSWYPRFSVEAVDNSCMPADDFYSECEDKNFHENAEFPNAEKFIEWAEPNYEIWQDCGDYGKVGTPKAFVQEYRKRPLMVWRTRRA